MRFNILCGVLLSMTTLGIAQEQSNVPKLTARMEPDSVGIGDHMTLILEVEQDQMQIVAFPEFEKASEKLELVEVPKLDTLERNERRLKLQRRYKFTTFEAGRYNLGRLSVLYMDKNVTDTLYADDSLRFTVGTFLIDSTSHEIFEAKPIKDMPFKFAEISGYAKWTLVVLILIALAILVTIKIMAKMGHSVMGLFKPKPPVAPHVAAFEALDKLRNEKLWQSGEYKGYYSKLTDILRRYISGRYSVAAMEMTTDEIISASKSLKLPKRCEMEMQELLRDADLVKFAKAEIEASLNEQYFESVKTFVELTKPEEESSEEETAEK